MTRPLLVVILSIILVGTWGSLAAAGEPYSLSKAYNLDKAEQGFKDPPKAEPSPTAIAADAVIGRPLGLATTIVGAGVFLTTFNFYIHSHSVGTAAWGLVGRPAGWTFNRPIGRSDPRYDRPGIFH